MITPTSRAGVNAGPLSGGGECRARRARLGRLRRRRPRIDLTVKRPDWADGVRVPPCSPGRIGLFRSRDWGGPFLVRNAKKGDHLSLYL